MGSPPPIRALPGIVEDKVRRVIECSACGTHHAVFSATSFCTVCGPRPAAATVIEAIEAVRQALAVEDWLEPEDREQLRAVGVFERFAVDAIHSVVSLFELYVREQFHQRVPTADAVVRGKDNVFQRLDNTARLFAAHTDIDIVQVAGTDRWCRLHRAFAQRHVLTHGWAIRSKRRWMRGCGAGRIGSGVSARASSSAASTALAVGRSTAAAMVRVARSTRPVSSTRSTVQSSSTTRTSSGVESISVHSLGRAAVTAPNGPSG